VIVQLGGQTALKLAGDLEQLGVPILGTPFDMDGPGRGPGQVFEILKELEIPFPPYGDGRT
jgi:carbamoyl-phosphate synthase large subunit